MSWKNNLSSLVNVNRATWMLSKKQTETKEAEFLDKLKMKKILIFILMSFYIGFPFTYCRKLADPINVSVTVLFLQFLIYMTFWSDLHKIKKDKLSLMTSGFIILFALLRQRFLYPFEFQIYDLWFISFGAYYMFNESALKELLKFSSILLAPPSLLLLYGSYWNTIDAFLALIGGFITAIMFSHETKMTLKESKVSKINGKEKVIVILSVLIFAFLSIQFLTFDPGVRKQGRILFDEGHETIESSFIPFNTNYNISAPFGHGKLLEFLKTYNYSVNVINNTITSQLLSNYDILVIIMSGKGYSADEIQAINEFVKKGGGLLVVADHTNINNVMNVLNPITENFGIHIRFDTVWLKPSGKGNLSYLRHPILWNLNEVYLSVGASLDTFSNAKPVLIARYSDFSDEGNPINVNNAYLGNEMHDPYEDVGDLILIASSQYGKGRVVVLSDSSYFQNAVLSRNYKFALRVFEWLNRKNIFSDVILITLLLLLVGISIVISICALRHGLGHILPLCFMISLIFALIVSSCINTYIYPDPDLNRLKHKVMLDMSHQSKYSTYWETGEWSDTGLDALYRQILRVGYHPFIENKKLTYDGLKKCDTLIIVAPNAPYSRDEINAIKMFVNKGGGLLIVEGDRNERVIDPLLSEFNVTLGKSLAKSIPDMNKPSLIQQFSYGRFISKLSDHVITRNVSNVSSINPCLVSGGEPIAFIDGEPMLCVVHYGRGKVIVVGDDMFFSNYVMETDSGYPLDLNRLRLTWNILKYLTEG